MSMRRKIASTIVVLSAVFSLSAVAFAGITNKAEYNFFKELYNPPRNLTAYMVRQDINMYVANRMYDEQEYQKIVAFYTQFTRNHVIADTIIKYAIHYNMPINLAFALSYVESAGFKVRAYRRNDNGSIDRGLFQLNNSYRKDWKTEDFYNIEKNVEEGIRYWAEECVEDSRSIPMTFIAYNYGPFSVPVRDNFIPDNRVEYVDDILSYEDMLNVEFNKIIRG